MKTLAITILIGFTVPCFTVNAMEVVPDEKKSSAENKVESKHAALGQNHDDKIQQLPMIAQIRLDEKGAVQEIIDFELATQEQIKEYLAYAHQQKAEVVSFTNGLDETLLGVISLMRGVVILIIVGTKFIAPYVEDGWVFSAPYLQNGWDFFKQKTQTGWTFTSEKAGAIREWASRRFGRNNGVAQQPLPVGQQPLHVAV